MCILQWILKYDQLAQHFCFANASVDSLVMDIERNILVQGKLNFIITNFHNIVNKLYKLFY